MLTGCVLSLALDQGELLSSVADVCFNLVLSFSKRHLSKLSRFRSFSECCCVWFCLGFTTQQSEVIVSALVKIMNNNLDVIYKDMVTKVQQVRSGRGGRVKVSQSLACLLMKYMLFITVRCCIFDV